MGLHKTISLILVIIGLAASSSATTDDPYSRTAIAAARWTEANGIITERGVVWPADPTNKQSVNSTLYAGTPGPVLFFLELYRYTHNRAYLKSARAGADALLAEVTREKGFGLYEGLSGIGFTLGEAYLITGDEKYRNGALQCVQRLKREARRAEHGVEWSDTTDIIAGGSGTGLFLLWASKELHAAEARDLAIAAGERLLELGTSPGPDQLKWMMDRTYPNEMPNFSHGTAGVAYFLATLYQATGQERFLEAALKGARYLLSIADKDGTSCLIYHDSSIHGKKLYYLGWCHGPAGTARLFYRLYQITQDTSWMEWTKKSAQAVVSNGGPERVVTPGAWNNVSVCCGTTAEAQFFLNMYQITRDPEYLKLSKRATQDLLSAATRDARGARWVQAENRVNPEVMIAQTGYMQGASGVGMWMLHMSAFMQRKRIVANNTAGQSICVLENCERTVHCESGMASSSIAFHRRRYQLAKRGSVQDTKPIVIKVK